MSWKVMGGAALSQGEGEEGPEPSASLAEAEPGGRGVMRLEGWKGQQRVAATPQRHVRRCGRCEGSPLEGVRQGSDGFSLLCLCPLRVLFMCLWLSPPCWELAEGRLSPLSFQELHEGRNHGPVPSDTSPSASGTVRLHWVAPPIRKCAPGAGMLSASVPAGSQARRRELCICHQWTTFLPGNAPPTSRRKPRSSAQVWPTSGAHAHLPGWATWGRWRFRQGRSLPPLLKLHHGE